ncbi:death domain-containing membrane protein NRADD isoform X2 [Desmodus rotundus]|uniref:death domain-containing membrane protein NRADD isoform X2 n=1 Tax=Desmodus rotundus TaxID=9430 RepID=UPI001E1BE53B|nr:death domain-containing membrane protein NRADD isoform X2 [Desmodus rotundus]
MRVGSQPLLDLEKSPSSLAWGLPLPMTLRPLFQEMQPLGALPAGREMLHNSGHREGLVHVDKTWKGQDRDSEGAWIGAGGALAPNTSSSFPSEPPGASGSIIPVYCALLATVVLGLLAYVAFKCWRSHKQRQELAKARTAELGALNRDQMHGDSSVLRDSSSGRESSVPSQGPHPELGCRLYLHLPQQQQEEVEQLLGGSGEPDKSWQGLARHLGYQAEAVETMARSQVPAYTLLRDWAVQEGSGATLRVLVDALAAMGREDVVRVLGLPPEDCSVV